MRDLALLPSSLFKLQTIYILFILLNFITSHATYIASANTVSRTGIDNDKSHVADVDSLCSDCRLTSSSVDELIRRPRRMDPYGQIEESIDRNKFKKAVCKSIFNDSDRERCRHFYVTSKSSIEKWMNQNGRISFFDFVCIKDLKYCCPANSFGPKCSKCPKCNSNKRCHGDGTRSGNGTCICKEGYTGAECRHCLQGFFEDKTMSSDGKQQLVCRQCHKSCLHCRGEGPTNCEVCKPGFYWESGFGCMDIDECLQSKNTICGENTFCVNTVGSYFCYDCDRACDGCHGDGPDMCLRCVKGYKLENGNCVALKKTILPPEANYYRYAIYVGLCICTCIIFHNSVYLASAIGLGVAIYMGASEYVMSRHEHDMMTKQQP